MAITRSFHAARRAAGFTLVAAAIALTAAACTQTLKLMKDDSGTVLSHQTINAPNPGEPGSFKVKRMYYGAGTDKQRAEYRDSVTLKTKTVDVSPFASVGAAQAKDRKKFWGFDMKKVPLNGRVWYPEGDGPFPLVLIVHGNHSPEKFSDPGYAYLGELLASRGFIMVSVDENFINGLSGENDGRAWLLLKHLEAWKRWNDSTGSPFYHRVDMNNIAVMGHSRGGEAAATAAAFNKLKYYPDDFKRFIRGVADELGIFLYPGLRTRNSSDSLLPLRAGYKCALFVSVDELKAPTNYHWYTDTPDNVNYGTVADMAKLSLELTRRLDW
jgi:hypothetical protein